MGKNRMIINTGTTSLIMIFGVLALVTFAAMSLSAAGAGWRMAEKMAERTSAYYQAEEGIDEAIAAAGTKAAGHREGEQPGDL